MSTRPVVSVMQATRSGVEHSRAESVLMSVQRLSNKYTYRGLGESRIEREQ